MDPEEVVVNCPARDNQVGGVPAYKPLDNRVAVPQDPKNSPYHVSRRPDFEPVLRRLDLWKQYVCQNYRGPGIGAPCCQIQQRVEIQR